MFKLSPIRVYTLLTGCHGASTGRQDHLVWLVVWNIFVFLIFPSIYLHLSSQSTNVWFQQVWNHQPDLLIVVETCLLCFFTCTTCGQRVRGGRSLDFTRCDSDAPSTNLRGRSLTWRPWRHELWYILWTNNTCKCIIYLQYILYIIEIYRLYMMGHLQYRLCRVDFYMNVLYIHITMLQISAQ